jgi:hypothetical protein
MVRRMTRSNRFSRREVVGPDGPVVSLTSHGRRVRTVYLTIESIARGRRLPSRLILWLDDEVIFRNLPESLLRLKRRGLEVRMAKNYGPHTKYYPYVASGDEFGPPLVTADDDILYPAYWLERLAQANAERPDLIHCYRARVIASQSDGLGPYNDWQMCSSTEANVLNFATGVSGVIYPPEFLSVLRKAGSEFERCCPRADDLWLNVQAVRSGYKVRQIVRQKDLHFLALRDTHQMALSNFNCQSGNDHQAKLTYGQNDLNILHRVFIHDSQKATTNHPD